MPRLCVGLVDLLLEVNLRIWTMVRERSSAPSWPAQAKLQGGPLRLAHQAACDERAEHLIRMFATLVPWLQLGEVCLQGMAIDVRPPPGGRSLRNSSKNPPPGCEGDGRSSPGGTSWERASAQQAAGEAAAPIARIEVAGAGSATKHFVSFLRRLKPAMLWVRMHMYN